jgi:hypothetical protein
MRQQVSLDAPVEISAEAFLLQCNERLRESLNRILVERDAERGVFRVNWRCWEVFCEMYPSTCFPIDEFQAIAGRCADRGYRLVEKGPPTKQQKAFKRLQRLCQQIQSALWSGRITWLGLSIGEETVRITELYAWDDQTILASCPRSEEAAARYFFVPASSLAFGLEIAQPEPFMLRVLGDPRIAMVLL